MLENRLKISVRGLFISLFVGLMFFPTVSFAEAKPSFYLRVGSGFSLSRNTHFDDADCRSSSPAALFGCSAGNDGRATGAYGDFDTSAAFDLGLGYSWNDWLRTGLAFVFRPGFEFDGESNFGQVNVDFKQKVEANLKNYSGMVVGVVKPLALFGVKNWRVEPLIMAGAGISYNKLDSMVYTFPKTSTTTPKGSNSDFAWSVGAGLSYAVRENIELEFLYRYSDLGEVETDVDNMTVTRLSDNSIITDSIEIGETRAELKVNEFILSLIFYFK